MMNNDHSDGQSAALELLDRLLARHRQEHDGVKGYLAAEEQGIRLMIETLIPHYYLQSFNERRSTDTETIRVPTPHLTENPSSSRQIPSLAEQKKSIDEVDLQIAGRRNGARIRAVIKTNQTLRLKIHFAENSKVKVLAQLNAANFQLNPKVVGLPLDKKKPRSQSYCVSNCECPSCIDIPLSKFTVNESDDQIGFKEQAGATAGTTGSTTLRNVHSLPLQLTNSSNFLLQSKE
ncbi:hypothetical protein M3Y96_00281400 [Aphelenchoides besseyi]|nr:hypothetical protein M3Y96_00281400 [Aphelenchoides besseyi]